MVYEAVEKHFSINPGVPVIDLWMRPGALHSMLEPVGRKHYGIPVIDIGH